MHPKYEWYRIQIKIREINKCQDTRDYYGLIYLPAQISARHLLYHKSERCSKSR